MSDLTLLEASSPLLGLLEMASLRLPDTEDYDVNARRRVDPGLMTSSSTDSSAANSAHFTSRMLHYRQLSPSNVTSRRGALGDSGTTIVDLLFDIAARNTSHAVVEKQLSVDEYSWDDDVNNTNGTYTPEFYRHSMALTSVYCVAYLVVFVVGLVGNSFVIAVVFRSPRMRTVTNFFIVNLAVADILVIVFCLPATLLSNIIVPWVLGWWMCKTVTYIQGISVAASVYSLIAVSLDRFLAIWWPLKCQITKRRARFMILLIWLFAVTTTIPWVIYFELIPFNNLPDFYICIEVWPDSTTGAIYFIITNLVLFYILPMIVISMCYILIWIKVWKRTIPTDTKDAQMERMQQKSKIKVVKMLVVVVILFVLSWLPLYVIFARIKLGGELGRWEDTLITYGTPIAQWLGSSNSCINPILYAFFNNKYRCGFLAILKSRSCCGRLRYYESVMMSSSASSMRKSSYYVNNNNSSTRRQPPAGQDAAVSYISNNAGI